MAKRFYFPSSGVPDISPAADAAWAVAPTTRFNAVTTKISSATSDQTNNSTGAAPENVCCVQYISAGLAAQTISGTVKGQAWCREGAAGLDACSQLVIRVLSSDGTVVRGTLLSAHAEALTSEWGSGAGARNRKFPLAALSPATLSSVDAQEGDRLAIEIGARVNGAVIAEARFRARDDSGSDLPEDETSGDIGNPWLEFSQTLLLAGQSANPTIGGALSCGVGVKI